ncbi:MAG: hypothetical protein CSA72_04875 [Rhodobacterales bacterium]|nr:MAG: hypothetical protein CSA72_04875 [Rhodobacterales bacterium]
MRAVFAMVVLAGLGAACAPKAPVSNPGPGFSNYTDYQREQARRDALLRGTQPAPVTAQPIGAPISAVPATGTVQQPVAAPAGASYGVDPLRTAGVQASPTNAAPVSYGADPLRTAGVQASPANAAPPSHTGISDEQSFSAVSSRETIESDAARRAQQAAAYQVVAPTALPTRSGETGPNIIQFALSTRNAKGQQAYTRGYTRQGKTQANCAKYGSPDAAQRAFLAGGGPSRNFEGMDPDGDGFACSWDPTPFRAAARQ